MPRPEPDPADPFGTADLRQATLAGWQGSPTRLAEDAAAEAELIEIGYRDRLFTELAANAADAAAAAGIVGRVSVRTDGTRVHVANTGAPLTADGVRSLTALRVSPKHRADGADGRATVGRFGMGFRATSLAECVVIASTTGAIEFDAARTAETVAALVPGADLDRLPTQRLAWPVASAPAAGFDTEVTLHLGEAQSAADLVASAAAQAADLLLELESIDRIDIDGHRYERRADGDDVVIDLDGVEHRRWLTARAAGARWLVPVSGGRLRPLSADVLRSPTATDIELTLPARVITDLPVTPDRRELHPDADVAAAAEGYPELVAAAPDDQKHLLIPPPALAAGRVDAALRQAIRDRLAHSRWVPSATGEALAPDRTWVLPGLTAELASLLGEVVEPLAHPDVSDRVTASLLVGLGARQLGLAEVADLLAGVDVDDPKWWARMYAALSASVADARDAEELATLPVPRADGRMHVGCRGLFLIDGLDAVDDPPVLSWVPTVAPEAYDPLLERLGLTRITAAQALEHPGLPAELDGADDHDDLADTVLRLLAMPDAGRAPAELGALELRGADGEYWPADELLLPGGPLAGVLVPDSPFGTVDEELVDHYGAEALCRLGVGWGFSVIVDPAPVAPDHDLPDEEQWWDTHDVPPEDLAAVRDLDLVDPDRWPEALALLAADEQTAPLLAGGYTRWWLRRYAEIGGTPLRHLRGVDDPTLKGLFDPVAVPEAAAGLLAGAAPDDADDAQAWLDALADPARTVAPGVAVRAHAALVAGVRAGAYRAADIEPPAGARTVDGGVADDPIVLDAPWWTAVVPAARGVLADVPPDAESAGLLAELLDCATATETYRALPDPDGDPIDPDSADGVALLAAAGLRTPRRLVVHDDLHVTLTEDGTSRRCRTAMWCDGPVVHLNRTDRCVR